MAALLTAAHTTLGASLRRETGEPSGPVYRICADVSAFGNCTTMHGKPSMHVGRDSPRRAPNEYVNEDALRRFPAVYALFAGRLRWDETTFRTP